MANFNKAFNRIIKAEGGYVNDPNDRGGETYLGISRRHHPYSEMWYVVDRVKRENPNSTNKQLTKLLKKETKLDNIVKTIYLEQYWNKLRCNEINSQKLAEQLFDMGVNAGIARAVAIMCAVIDYNTYSTLITDKLVESINNYGKRINTYKI